MMSLDVPEEFLEEPDTYDYGELFEEVDEETEEDEEEIEKAIKYYIG